MTEKHTCIKDDGGTPNRRCYACEEEAAQESRSVQRRKAQQRGEPMPTFSGDSLMPDSLAAQLRAFLAKHEFKSHPLPLSPSERRLFPAAADRLDTLERKLIEEQQISATVLAEGATALAEMTAAKDTAHFRLANIQCALQRAVITDTIEKMVAQAISDRDDLLKDRPKLYACQDALAACQDALAACQRELAAIDAKLRTVTPCPVCEWPLPPDADHFICPCCGCHVSYDEATTNYVGGWWNTRQQPPRIVRLLTLRAETAEARLADVRALLQSYEPREADRTYYGKALDLVADELAKLAGDQLDARRWKMVAVLRHAAADTSPAERDALRAALKDVLPKLPERQTHTKRFIDIDEGAGSTYELVPTEWYAKLCALAQIDPEWK